VCVCGVCVWERERERCRRLRARSFGRTNFELHSPWRRSFFAFLLWGTRVQIVGLTNSWEREKCVWKRDRVRVWIPFFVPLTVWGNFCVCSINLAFIFYHVCHADNSVVPLDIKIENSLKGRFHQHLFSQSRF